MLLTNQTQEYCAYIPMQRRTEYVRMVANKLNHVTQSQRLRLRMRSMQAIPRGVPVLLLLLSGTKMQRTSL